MSIKDFPAYQPQGQATKTQVDTHAREDFSRFFIFQGQDTEFTPGGLRTPDWFIAINPNGYDDPECGDIDLNETFAPYNVDVRLVLVDGDLEDIKRAMWQRACDTAWDHYEVDNGALLATWQLPGGQVIVAGMDNGGDDEGQEGALTVAKGCGKVIKTASGWHFDPTNVLDPENYEGNDRLETLAELARMV